MEENRNGDCPEEKIAHGDIGVVKDDEMLARFVLLGDTDLINAHNRLLKGALKTKEFQKGNGWSLLREGHVNDMAEELEKHASRKGRRAKDYGYALVSAVHIRQIRDEMQRRAICVIDDPQESPAHTLSQKARDYTKWEGRLARDELLKKFTEVLTH